MLQVTLYESLKINIFKKYLTKHIFIICNRKWSLFSLLRKQKILFKGKTVLIFVFVFSGFTGNGQYVSRANRSWVGGSDVWPRRPLPALWQTALKVHNRGLWGSHERFWRFWFLYSPYIVFLHFHSLNIFYDCIEYFKFVFEFSW